MIRIKPSVTKPSKTVHKKHIKSVNQENIKPSTGFNTRGYFDPAEPCNEQYFKLKQQVFEKYRNKKEEIVMIDLKNSNKAAFIHRGLLVPSKLLNVDSSQSRTCSLEPTSFNLLKTYLLRKERKQQMEQERFLDVPKVSCDQVTLRSTPLTARSVASRQVSSRISTNSVLRIDADL